MVPWYDSSQSWFMGSKKSRYADSEQVDIRTRYARTHHFTATSISTTNDSLREPSKGPSNRRWHTDAEAVGDGEEGDIEQTIVDIEACIPFWSTARAWLTRSFW